MDDLDTVKCGDLLLVVMRKKTIPMLARLRSLVRLWHSASLLSLCVRERCGSTKTTDCSTHTIVNKTNFIGTTKQSVFLHLKKRWVQSTLGARKHFYFFVLKSVRSVSASLCALWRRKATNAAEAQNAVAQTLATKLCRCQRKWFRKYLSIL